MKNKQLSYLDCIDKSQCFKDMDYIIWLIHKEVRHGILDAIYQVNEELQDKINRIE